jgi:WD40 repeat protein
VTILNQRHEDDMTSVAFCPPSLLATASVDGIILVWNLESGVLKHALREPFLDLRGKSEKCVEKVRKTIHTLIQILFLYSHSQRKRITSRHRIPLLSCHGDGFVRFWDAFNGTLTYEVFQQD